MQHGLASTLPSVGRRTDIGEVDGKNSNAAVASSSIPGGGGGGWRVVGSEHEGDGEAHRVQATEDRSPLPPHRQFSSNAVGAVDAHHHGTVDRGGDSSDESIGEVPETVPPPQRKLSDGNHAPPNNTFPFAQQGRVLPAATVVASTRSQQLAMLTDQQQQQQLLPPLHASPGKAAGGSCVAFTPVYKAFNIAGLADSGASYSMGNSGPVKVPATEGLAEKVREDLERMLCTDGDCGGEMESPPTLLASGGRRSADCGTGDCEARSSNNNNNSNSHTQQQFALLPPPPLSLPSNYSAGVAVPASAAAPITMEARGGTGPIRRPSASLFASVVMPHPPSSLNSSSGGGRGAHRSHDGSPVSHRLASDSPAGPAAVVGATRAPFQPAPPTGPLAAVAAGSPRRQPLVDGASSPALGASEASTALLLGGGIHHTGELPAASLLPGAIARSLELSSGGSPETPHWSTTGRSGGLGGSIATVGDVTFGVAASPSIAATPPATLTTTATSSGPSSPRPHLGGNSSGSNSEDPFAAGGSAKVVPLCHNFSPTAAVAMAAAAATSRTDPSLPVMGPPTPCCPAAALPQATPPDDQKPADSTAVAGSTPGTSPVPAAGLGKSFSPSFIMMANRNHSVATNVAFRRLASRHNPNPEHSVPHHQLSPTEGALPFITSACSQVSPVVSSVVCPVVYVVDLETLSGRLFRITCSGNTMIHSLKARVLEEYNGAAQMRPYHLTLLLQHTRVVKCTETVQECAQDPSIASILEGVMNSSALLLDVPRSSPPSNTAAHGNYDATKPQPLALFLKDQPTTSRNHMSQSLASLPPCRKQHLYFRVVRDFHNRPDDCPRCPLVNGALPVMAGGSIVLAEGTSMSVLPPASLHPRISGGGGGQTVHSPEGSPLTAADAANVPTVQFLGYNTGIGEK